MEYILLNTEKRRRLQEKFGVSNITISHALHFKHGSLLKREIRAYAVNWLGGNVVCAVY